MGEWAPPLYTQLREYDGGCFCRNELGRSLSEMHETDLKVVEKVVAYIMSGSRLLVFRHVDFPEAGVQAPAGTVDPGEAPDDAVLREAQEETGLCGLTIRSYQGTHDYDDPTVEAAVVHRRYYYHLDYAGVAPSIWRHFEEHPSGGDTERIEFELYWVPYPDEVPELAGRLGDFLDGVELG